MKERPILFSGQMVRAILDGRKTQTRRVIKPQPIVFSNGVICSKDHKPISCPYGQPGDRFWVRETWGPCEGGFCYRASENERALPDDGRWHPSIHMFREASRITLEIESVRVERLNEITTMDIEREGIQMSDSFRPGHRISDLSARLTFFSLWDSINSKRNRGTALNPWVWVINFRRME